MSEPETVSGAAKHRWQGSTEQAIASAGTACGIVVLAAVLFFVTAFLGTPVYERGPVDAAAYNVSFSALGCCLLALIAIVMAAIGLRPPVLYPLAAAALVQAAVFCVLARHVWAALPLLVLATATPWWSVPRPRLGLASGLIATAMLWLSFTGYRSMAEAVDRSRQPLVCRDAAPAIVARLENSLTVSGVTLRQVHVVHSRTDPSLWFLAANVEGGGYGSRFDTAEWIIQETGDTDPDVPDTADRAYASNNLASEITDLEYNWAFEEATVVAEDCARGF